MIGKRGPRGAYRERVQVMMGEAVVRVVKRLAKAEGVSVSGWVRGLVVAELGRRGEKNG